MDLKDIATAFGLPGLMIGFWYLLELAKNRRLAEQEKRASDQERARHELEERKVTAMTVGFQQLGAMINEHTKVDLQHHGKVGESIAELHGKLDGLLDAQDRFTPVGAIPVPRTPRGVERQTPARGTEYAQYRRGTTRNEDE